MLLAKIYWRRFRCEDCGSLFELPLNDPTLPPHGPRGRRADGNLCAGATAAPA